ncbi:MAG: integration host factor subunit beta [Candidatus Binatia bacterium]|nr:MAG: integration host factor subunit beta [Candidatus Binatia bacterium]
MTRRDLIEEVVRLYPRFSRRDAEVLVKGVFEAMAEALVRGDRIEIRGFGSFFSKHRQRREGRNPRTGKVVFVEAKRVPFFKVGKELRLRVNGRRSSEPVPREAGAPSPFGSPRLES